MNQSSRRNSLRRPRAITRAARAPWPPIPAGDTSRGPVSCGLHSAIFCRVGTHFPALSPLLPKGPPAAQRALPPHEQGSLLSRQPCVVFRQCACRWCGVLDKSQRLARSGRCLSTRPMNRTLRRVPRQAGNRLDLLHAPPSPSSRPQDLCWQRMAAEALERFDPDQIALIYSPDWCQSLCADLRLARRV